MNVGFNIPIHRDSEEYIRETFSQYEEVDRMREIENPIIHMYAIEDTRDLETGDLNGYSDSMFCEYRYYDTKKMKFFKTRKHDALYLTDIPVSNIKIFKDGSTLIHLRYGKYEIGFGTAVHLYKI
jgi:hypothetical protein